MVYNSYELYGLSTRRVQMLDKRKELELKIVETEAMINRVYGSCKDGSYGLAKDTMLVPLINELVEIDKELHKQEAWNE